MELALRLGMLRAVMRSTSNADGSATSPAVASKDPVELAAARGERAALEVLLRTHAPAMLSICQQFAGAQEARDALQESLERVVQQILRFDPAQGSFRSWAFTVTRNVCRDRLRRRGLERASFARDGGEQTQLALDAAPDPERVAIARQGADGIAHALAELPEDMRAALVMFHVHEASYEEIARSLSVPLGTVMTWLHRGRHRLRAAVEASSARNKEART